MINIKTKIFTPTEKINLYQETWSELFSKFIPHQDLILTSPPYNIGSKGERKDGFRKNGAFDPKSFGAIRGYDDNLDEALYQEQQRDFLTQCAAIISDTGIIAYNHKNRHRNRELISPHRWFPNVLTLQDEIVLNRRSSHNNEKSFMQPTTERLYIFKKSKIKTYLNKEKTDNFIQTKDVWDFPIVKDSSIDRHCAPFDLNFAREVIFRYCPPGGKVCDPYSGSGTTMLACFIENREFIGSEKMEKWFLKSQERFNRYANR
jgi:DNA modification methylase